MDDENEIRDMSGTNGSGGHVQANGHGPAGRAGRPRRQRVTQSPGRKVPPEPSPRAPKVSDRAPKVSDGAPKVSDRAVHGAAVGVQVGDFFGELARQLAVRWLSLLVIPGVLVLAAGWTAVQLGQSHALDAGRLAQAAGRVATQIANWPVAAQLLGGLAVLLGAVAAGFVAQALVCPVRALSLGQWPPGLGRLAGLRTQRRRDRWNDLYRERSALEMVHPRQDRTTEQQQRIDRIAGRTNQIAMAEPGRPTWMGDRIHALTQVTINRYGLDLTFGWPRLWLVLPDGIRAEINAAQGGFGVAVFTIAWSLPYLALGTLWWPAAAIGIVIALAGWSRARAKISLLTDLAEAALDVHGRALAIALDAAGPTSAGPLTLDEGRRITDITRKGR